MRPRIPRGPVRRASGPRQATPPELNDPKTPPDTKVTRRFRPKPAAPPDSRTATDTSDTGRNGRAIAGFVFSLAAIVPPVWLGYSFAANYDEWFAGYGLFGSNAGWTALFVIFIFLPGELILLLPAFILSLTGTKRAKRNEQPRPPLVTASLIISTIATVTLAAVVVVAVVGAS